MGFFDHWNAQLALVQSNTANAKLLCIGDSTTAGGGAGNGGVPASYPYKLAGLFNASLNPTQGAIFGLTAGVADSRVSMGAWTITSSLPFGYTGFRGNTGGGSPLAITFAQSFDTITVYHVQGPSVGGVSAVDVDGGASLGNVSGVNGTLRTHTTVFTCAAGTHTINIATPTGASLWIIGIEVSLSSTKRVLVANAGRAGATTANFNTNTAGTGSKQSFDEYQPDLTIINLSINDAGASTAAATMKSRLSDCIDFAQAWGDVLVVNPNLATGSPYTTYQPLYTPEIADLCTTQGCAYFDLTGRTNWTSYAAANSAGYMADAVHPSANGYTDIAAAVYAVLAAANHDPAQDMFALF